MNQRGDTSATLPERDGKAWALVRIVVGLALFNSLATFLWPTSDSVKEFLLFGAMDAQPLLFGMWTALAAGSVLTRIPMAVSCLMLLFVVPGYVPAAFADLQQREFVAAILAGMAVYAVAVFLFVLFRRFTGFQIQSVTSNSSNDSRVRFSTRYLLILITVVAVVLGLSTQMQFQQKAPSWSFLGPNFFVVVITYGTAILTGAVVPMLAVPLAILHGHPSRRAILWAIAFWAIVILLFFAFIIIGQGNPVDDLAAVLLAQVGASLIGAVAAVSLRVVGMRLVRYG